MSSIFQQVVEQIWGRREEGLVAERITFSLRGWDKARFERDSLTAVNYHVGQPATYAGLPHSVDPLQKEDVKVHGSR